MASHKFKLWDILLQLLLQSEQEASKTAIRILSRLKLEFSAASKEPGDKFEYDTIAMNRLAIELFVEFYFERLPSETFVFLLKQYEVVCEFETAPGDSEEEFEVCFDKGVESVQNSHYYHLIDLCEVLHRLVLQLTEGSSNSLWDSTLLESLNDSFSLICSRLKTELYTAVKTLKQMHFNELQFTKVTSHLMFLQKLAPYVNESNRTRLEDELTQLKGANKKLLNSFMHVYLE